MDASATLDTFNDDSGDVALLQLGLDTFRILQVTESDLMDGIERRNDLGVVSHRHGARSAAVETAPEGNHPVAAGVEGRQF